jgi:HAMP domain-containing protein
MSADEDILGRLDHWVRLGISPDMSAAREEIVRLRKMVRELTQSVQCARDELLKAEKTFQRAVDLVQRVSGVV